MSYYQPFYYPYFSARSELPNSLLELERKLALQQYDSHPIPAVSYLNHQARKLDYVEHAHSALMQAELERASEQRRLQAEIQAQIEMKREDDYLQRIAALRRERELLDMVDLKARDRNDLRNNNKNEQYMTDDELLKYYSSGEKFQQYQREMKYRADHAQQNDRNARNQKEKGIATKLAYSQETQHSPKKANNQRQLAQDIQQNNNRLIEEQIKRSYIDELKQSKGQEKNQDRTFYNQTMRGETLDLFATSKIESPAAHKYGAASKNKRNRKGSHSISHQNYTKRRQNKDISHLQVKKNRTFTASTIDEAMKKINNRLKVSAIVYKDSKLRNQRHEIDHLFNTFQNQLKGRRQVKDKINTHPDILKKHNMVVGAK